MESLWVNNRRSEKKKFKNVLTNLTLCVILNVSNEREENKNERDL